MILDTGKAWTEATKMLAANRELVLVLAGVFFFIPLTIMLVMLFGSDFDFGPAGADPDPELISKQVNAIIVENWWALLMVAIGQLAGAIAILALLGDPKKPTVGEVMGIIPKLLLTVIAAQIIATLAAQALPSLAEFLPPTIKLFGSLFAFVVSIYITVKFSLATAVVVIEKQMNPITALKESWMMTKGKSLRIFLFFFLLVITGIVLALVVALSFGLVFTMLGDRFQLIGNAVVLSALISAFYALAYAIVAAIYRQLTGPTTGEVAETFD